MLNALNGERFTVIEYISVISAQNMTITTLVAKKKELASVTLCESEKIFVYTLLEPAIRKDKTQVKILAFFIFAAFSFLIKGKMTARSIRISAKNSFKECSSDKNINPNKEEVIILPELFVMLETETVSLEKT